ncbi:hypothetical protein NECID01_0918 [Nematocida sp. AWRm77]|nr:hypothetical protein NECID01_0918 [Nematocida sp. AWRm77]
MKKFLVGVNEVNKELESFRSELEEMKQLTRKVSGAANDKEAQALRSSLTELREDFIDGMNTAKKGIENLKIKAQEGKSEHEKHIKEQHIKSLIERVKKMVEEFSTAQAEFGAEERHRLKSQYIIAKPTATKEELDKVEYEDSPDPFMVTQKTKPETQARKQSLKHISSGIQQVTQMADQLNLLVHKSDRNVDKISVTTSTTEVKAKKADKDLKQALKYQKLARFAKMIAIGALLFLVFMFFLMIIGGIVFLVIVLARNISPQTLGNATGLTPLGNSTDTGNSTGTDGGAGTGGDAGTDGGAGTGGDTGTDGGAGADTGAGADGGAGEDAAGTPSEMLGLSIKSKLMPNSKARSNPRTNQAKKKAALRKDTAQKRHGANKAKHNSTR